MAILRFALGEKQKQAGRFAKKPKEDNQIFSVFYIKDIRFSLPFSGVTEIFVLLLS